MIPDDPLAYLFSLERLGMKFGLETITALCQSLGHPERSFESVIVAGTNGKGSVTAMVDTALRAAHHRVARYTSPHLVRIEERFVIDGTEVSSGALQAAAARVRSAIAALLAQGAIHGPPTFFEATTAAAFELFRDATVEIAVLEVGLGGRLDATNVVLPVVAAITSVDLDHQAQLGTTIEAIAYEKAGVIKPSIPVVCGPLPPAAEQVVRDVCADRGATMIKASDAVQVTEHDGSLDVQSHRQTLSRVRLALAGRHQIENARVAVAVLDTLADRGLAIDEHAVRAGLSATRWPGRLERFRHGAADVLLDAAHNPAGARALASYLREIGWTGVTIVFGAMRDKDVSGMLAPLSPMARAFVCTTPASTRAMPAADLALHVTGGPHVEIVDDPVQALHRACALDTRVVVAGSIFLIGPLRDILR